MYGDRKQLSESESKTMLELSARSFLEISEAKQYAPAELSERNFLVKRIFEKLSITENRIGTDPIPKI